MWQQCWRDDKNKNIKEWKERQAGADMKGVFPFLYLTVFQKHILICLFVQIESLWGEEKQSSNSSNEITVRSEPRSYRSLCFKNIVSPQTPQAALYIWQQTMWNPKSKEQGSQCVSDWIKERLNKLHKGRIYMHSRWNIELSTGQTSNQWLLMNPITSIDAWMTVNTITLPLTQQHMISHPAIATSWSFFFL